MVLWKIARTMGIRERHWGRVLESEEELIIRLEEPHGQLQRYCEKFR